MKILITAFEPFQNQSDNASLDLLQALSTPDETLTIEKRILPVVFQPELLTTLIQPNDADFIIHLGEASLRHHLSLECQAVNEMDALISDNEGVIKSHQPIDPFGKPMIQTSFPTEAIIESLKNQHLPVEISYDAGKFICNLVYYLSLSHAKIPVIFIHIPRFSHQKHALEAALTLSEGLRTLKLIISVLITFIH